MIKLSKRIRLNFRQTKSDRSASQSYKNYQQRARKIFLRKNP